MNILEKIKELRLLKAELGEDDIEEKQAISETIIKLVKQMSSVDQVEKTAEDKPIEPSKVIIKNGDFELHETQVPEDSISQIMSKTKYIPQ